MSQIKTSIFDKIIFKQSIDPKELKELKTNEVLKYSQMFFFFDKDYHSQAKFWECFIFFRKFLLSFIMSINDSIGFEVSFVILSFMMITYLNYTLSIKPYRSKRANSLEILSLVCLIIILFLTESRNIIDGDYYLELCIFLIGFSFLFIFSFYVIVTLRMRMGHKINFKKNKSNLKMNFAKKIVRVKRFSFSG